MRLSAYNLVDQSDKSGKMPIVCNLTGYAKVRYNRELDHIFINPCSGVKPKKYEAPFSWNTEYFCNHLDECIKEYEQLNIDELSEYYEGTCILRYKFGDYRLCTHYNYNNPITGINNSILTACNLKCIMCNECRSFDKKEAKAYLMLLDSMVDRQMQYSGLTHVGEPFLYKKESIEYLNNCKSDEVVILTNAMLLDRNDLDNIRSTMNKRKLDFSISIDGITKEVYESIRPSANFEKVMDNIIYARDIGLLHHINYTIQDANRSERNTFKKFFDDLGIKVYIMIAYDFNKNTDTGLSEQLIKNNVDRTLRL